MSPDRGVQYIHATSHECVLCDIVGGGHDSSNRSPTPIFHRQMQIHDSGSIVLSDGASRACIESEPYHNEGEHTAVGLHERGKSAASHESHSGKDARFLCLSNHDRHRRRRPRTERSEALAGWARYLGQAWWTRGILETCAPRKTNHVSGQLTLRRCFCLILKILGLAAFLTSCQAETLNCTLASGDTSIMEKQCSTTGDSSWHFFEVTVAGGAAEELVTYMSSPSSATCSGPAGGFLCSPPVGEHTSYLAMSGEGCVPDELNNNWQDFTPTFSKQVTVCKPCLAGSYWLAFKLLQNTSCDLRVWAPAGSKPSSSASSCSIASRTAAGGGGRAAACTAGLQRTNLAPVVVTQCELPDGRACLFGACNDWLWLAAWFGVGAFPSLVLGACVCSYRQGYKKERKIHEDAGIYNNVAARVPVYSNTDDVVVQDLNTADLAKEFDSDADDDRLPDQLPPTFFVNDRYDAN